LHSSRSLEEHRTIIVTFYPNSKHLHEYMNILTGLDSLANTIQINITYTRNLHCTLIILS